MMAVDGTIAKAFHSHVSAWSGKTQAVGLEQLGIRGHLCLCASFLLDLPSMVPSG